MNPKGFGFGPSKSPLYAAQKRRNPFKSVSFAPLFCPRIIMVGVPLLYFEGNGVCIQ